MILRLSFALCFITVAQSNWHAYFNKARNNLNVIAINTSTIFKQHVKTYEPTWDSLDSRPLPSWYDKAKVGIFIHWGVYSVPSFGSEWFWNFWQRETLLVRTYHDFMKKNYKPGFTYQDFARDFTAEFYDPKQWAMLFEASGAKYVVFTSKHHEGYAMWPSKYSFSWNAMDVGPNRDLVGDLADAVRKYTSMHFGLYHSLFEWYNPVWLADQKSRFQTDDYAQSKALPEMYEIVEKYKPDVFWSDGDPAPDTYWKSKEFLAYLYNDSPVKDTVVTNDRWGDGTACKHGDFYSCADRYNPGHLLPHKWENAMTIDKKSWGYRREASLDDYLTIKDLVRELASTVSCGGNILINVGPTKEGLIAPIFQDRLLSLGYWLKVNGEAIYETVPWTTQNDTVTGDTWYTASTNSNAVYAVMLTWPDDDTLKLGALPSGQKYTFEMFGHAGIIEWRQTDNRIDVDLPPKAHGGHPAWAFKITT